MWSPGMALVTVLPVLSPSRLIVALVTALVCVATLATVPGLAVEPTSGQPATDTPNYSDDDALQPPSPVRVLPTRCTGRDNVIPVRARPCRITRFGSKDRPLVVVWGDSHAWQQTPAIIAEAERTRTSLVVFQMGACPPMLIDPRTPGECAKMGRLVYEFVATRALRGLPTTVILGGAWAFYRGVREGSIATTDYLARQAALSDDGIPAALRALGKLRRTRLVGLAQMPMIPEGACAESYACDLPRAQAVPDEERYKRWLARRTDLTVDATGFVCSLEVCLAQVDGVPTYLDALHLNPEIAPEFTPLYREAFAG